MHGFTKNILPTMVDATAQQQPTTPSIEQPHNNYRSQQNNFRNIDPARFAYVGPTMTDTENCLWH